MAFARFEEEKDIDFTPAKFLVSLLDKSPTSIKTTLARAFRISEDTILFTELPSVIPAVDPKSTSSFHFFVFISMLFENESLLLMSFFSFFFVFQLLPLKNQIFQKKQFCLKCDFSRKQ
jgi:hypothetical protein